MKKYTILKWVVVTIAVAINIFIIVNSFIAGAASAKESNNLAHTAADIINDIKPETITEQNFETFAYKIRKIIGHFALCGVSGIFTTWAIYLFCVRTKLNHFGYQIAISLGYGLFQSSFTELVQLFVSDRVGKFKDIGINALGYFIGVLLVILILLILKKPIFKLSKKEENQASN